MRTAGRRSIAAIAALALSLASLTGAAILGSGSLAALGGLALIVGLLALDRVPRDRGW